MDKLTFGEPLRPWALEPPLGSETLSFALNRPYPQQTVNSCIALYLSWKYWISRKTYYLTVLDAETNAQTIRWELELPSGLPRLPGSDQFLVPVAIFSREAPLAAATISDDSGREVQLLTARENEVLTHQMRRSVEDFSERLATTRGAELQARRKSLGEEMLLREVVGTQELLEEGDWGVAIRRLQSLLGLSPASGKFDAATKQAVEEFRKTKGLGAHGFVDSATAASLLGDSSRSQLKEPLDPDQLAWFPDPNTGYLQTVLMTDPTRLRRSLTLEYESRTDRVEPGDAYSQSLPARTFERLFGERVMVREPDGLLNLSSSRLAMVWPISGLGDAERSRIEYQVPAELEIEAVSGLWMAPDNPASGKDLKEGDHGVHVRRLQSILDLEPASGEFDDSTVQAVKAFQKEANELKEEAEGLGNKKTLLINGRVDSDTASRLMELRLNPLPVEVNATGSRAHFLPGDSRRAGNSASTGDGHAAISPESGLPHLWATWRDQPAFMMVFLRPRWEELRDSFLGLGLGSVILLVAAGLALIGSLLVAPDLVTDRVNKVPLAAVVAFTASIATSLLIQGDKNEMAGFLLRPIRLRLAALGLLPVLAAVTIAIPVEPWINGVILLGLAGVELAYTLKCRNDLKDLGRPNSLTRAKARKALAESRIRFVGESEMFRKFDFEDHVTQKHTPLTDDALLGAAQEFAAKAGWHLDKG